MIAGVAFWTGLLMGAVLGSFLAIAIVMFFMNSSGRMSRQEWEMTRQELVPAPPPPPVRDR